MKVSRREFVSTASCTAVASLCAFPSLGFDNGAPAANVDVSCTLVDLESNCALPESFAAMRAALGDAHRFVAETEFASRKLLTKKISPPQFTADERTRVVIVAGSGTVRAETFETLRELLERGVTVLWESGAAFLSSADFAGQQALLLDHFEISMQLSIDVWPRAARTLSFSEKKQGARGIRAIGHEQVPYVAYRWPREMHVRDFSRVVPVSATNGGAIAHFGNIAVAWNKPVGQGTLVFIGSPIGPALRAGDSAAHALLQSMIAI